MNDLLAAHARTFTSHVIIARYTPDRQIMNELTFAASDDNDVYR